MSNLVRIDKNTVYNYLNFDAHGEDSGDIIRCLLLYFSKSHQYQFFGFGKLDPVAFSKEMKISRSRLFSKATKPFQFQNLDNNQIDELYKLEEEDPENFRVYDNNLENALFILLKSNILYPSYLSKKSIKGKTASLKSVQVLTELRTHFKKQRGGEKINYSYTLSKEFQDNLSTYFLHLNIVDIIKLRKPNLDGLYMMLSNEIQTMKANFIEMKELDFDDLCRRASIDSKEPRFKKSRLKKALERIQNDTSLSSEVFAFEFIKKTPKSKYEYKVMIINKIFYKDQKEKHQIYDTRFKKILDQNIYRDLLDIYKALYDINENTIKNDFNQWLKLSDTKDKEEKILAYKTAYFRVKGELPSYIDQEIKSFFKELKNIPENVYVIN